MFRRFFLLLVGWTAGAVAGMAVLAWPVVQAAKESARNYHRQLAEHGRQALDRYARELNGRFAFVQDLQRSAPESAAAFKLLQAAAATHGDFALLALVEPDGRERARVADARLFPGPTPSGLWTAAAAAARGEGEPALGAVTELRGTPVLPVVYALGGRRLLYAAMNLEGLWTALRQPVGRTGRMVLADATGALLPPRPEGFPPRLTAATAPEGWLELRESGAVWIGAYRRSQPLGWIVATIQPREEAYLHADRLLLNLVLLFLALAAAAAASAALVSRRIVAPLTHLLEGARRASQNVFAPAVPEEGWPELRALTRRFNDMMEKLRAYQELQVEKVLEEKSKVDALVQTIPEGLLMTDLQQRVVFMNPSVAALLGPGGKPPSADATLRAVVSDPKAHELADALLRRRSRWVSGETEVRVAGGGTRHLKILGTTVSVGRRDAGILLLFRDISLEKQLDRMKEEFFSSVVHDLRNPLGTLKIVLDLSVAGRTLTEREERFRRVAEHAYGELNGLLEDVLDLSRLEAGGSYPIAKVPADLAAVARDAVSLAELICQEKGIALSFTSDAGMGAVPMDAGKIRRVASNLIGNAVKYTPRGGRVAVTVRRTGESAELAVQDTGPGIPPDKLGLVFEKFKQLDPARDQRTGFGLGLTICKRFVELHGGKIWAESPPGIGTRFAFTLPL